MNTFFFDAYKAFDIINRNKLWLTILNKEMFQSTFIVFNILIYQLHGYAKQRQSMRILEYALSNNTNNVKR